MGGGEGGFRAMASPGTERGKAGVEALCELRA